MGAGAEVRLVNPCLLMCTGRGSSPSIASGGFFTCFLPTNRCVFGMSLKSLQIAAVWPATVPTAREYEKH